ncbi:hypothetical protein [Stutzerimonas nitrititolerans]|uniref:TolA protein n=1 Tax=Stutzerimonas nitrititolerans TaxID=2482751 RepID=A0ABX9V3W1_9GAMM|nr:hypothetical protein [Stutzerimonas nitrititolerans]RMI00492.1 hypothetical protein EA795_13310 [Stutzerimonas nitrititolerans]
MSTETQLIALEDISADKAPVIYGHNKLTAYVALAREQAANEVPDLTTRKGRERIASLAAQVSRSKTAVEKPGRDYLRRIKEMPKAIEAELREFVQEMDKLRDEVRAPLTEWEAAEEARKAKHQGAIDQINLRLECRDLDSSELCQNIEWLETMAIDESWEEFESEALRAKDKALAALREALVARERYEAEQAELERLRAEAAQREQKEREERIAREAAEQAQREAEQRAQAERDAAAKREADAKAAAERRELELKLQAEQAEREKLEAQRRAEQAERDAAERAERAAAAERQRQADEQARQEAEAKAREADIAHKTAVLTSIKEAFMAAGVTEEQAKAIINMIRKGEVPSVSITY